MPFPRTLRKLEAAVTSGLEPTAHPLVQKTAETNPSSIAGAPIEAE